MRENWPFSLFTPYLVLCWRLNAYACELFAQTITRKMPNNNVHRKVRDTWMDYRRKYIHKSRTIIISPFCAKNLFLPRKIYFSKINSCHTKSKIITYGVVTLALFSNTHWYIFSFSDQANRIWRRVIMWNVFHRVWKIKAIQRNIGCIGSNGAERMKNRPYLGTEFPGCYRTLSGIESWPFIIPRNKEELVQLPMKCFMAD